MCRGRFYTCANKCLCGDREACDFTLYMSSQEMHFQDNECVGAGDEEFTTCTIIVVLSG
jgi:hypothetical protein